MILYTLARKMLGLTYFQSVDYTMFTWYRAENGDVVLVNRAEEV